MWLKKTSAAYSSDIILTFSFIFLCFPLIWFWVFWFFWNNRLRYQTKTHLFFKRLLLIDQAYNFHSLFCSFVFLNLIICLLILFKVQIELSNYLYERLLTIPGIRIYGPVPSDKVSRGALCSFNVDGIHPTDIATFLDQPVKNCALFLRIKSLEIILFVFSTNDISFLISHMTCPISAWSGNSIRAPLCAAASLLSWCERKCTRKPSLLQYKRRRWLLHSSAWWHCKVFQLFQMRGLITKGPWLSLLYNMFTSPTKHMHARFC